LDGKARLRAEESKKRSSISAIFGKGSRFWQLWRKGLSNERNRDITVRRLQRAELLDYQEQEDYDWAVGVQEVLQALPQAYRA